VIHHLAVVPIIAVVTMVLASVSPGWTLLIWGIESIAVIIVLVTSGETRE
jgi:hypothetical protein